jgi:hypothetical protein
MSNQSHDPAEALAKSAELYRRIDEEATERHYFRFHDEEDNL